ncbi:mannose-1-phosphate guanylyltransferase [bacterium]|jgi:mannose-1-phosphate guanylyltransferase|nr:mannose-1-phosphate guanylyltransferase [bacterium]
MSHHIVIMAGGIGTRFWPLSRQKKAKQFLPIIGDDSLIEQTISRLSPLLTNTNLWIVTNKNQKSEFDSLNLPAINFLYEPEGKNTLPCIGWAAQEISKKDSDATMVVLPADHFIKDHDLFISTLKEGIEIAESENALITIGIKPTSPHTGYGYIETDSAKKTTSLEKGMSVLSFHEKPNIQTALSYIEHGSFYWNSGMFIWTTSQILSAIETYQPKQYERLTALKHLHQDSPEFLSCFKSFDSISIDYGILEKAPNIKMISGQFSWSDVGSWSSLSDFWEQDDNGNSIKGDYVGINSHNNLIYSEKGVVSLIDTNDHMVIQTEDALLIAPITSDQKVKDLHEQLPNKLK